MTQYISRIVYEWTGLFQVYLKNIHTRLKHCPVYTEFLLYYLLFCRLWVWRIIEFYLKLKILIFICQEKNIENWYISLIIETVKIFSFYFFPINYYLQKKQVSNSVNIIRFLLICSLMQKYIKWIHYIILFICYRRI